MKFLGKSQSGFSLVELMIVVAIIGVLAALAVPKFASFQAKARQAEAKTNLSHIYTLQESYYGDNEEYGTLPAAGIGQLTTAAAGCTNTANELGFNLRPCVATAASKVRYKYANTTTNDLDYVVTATSGAGADNRIMPNCATIDTWTVTETKQLTQTINAVALCL